MLLVVHRSEVDLRVATQIHASTREQGLGARAGINVPEDRREVVVDQKGESELVASVVGTIALVAVTLELEIVALQGCARQTNLAHQLRKLTRGHIAQGVEAA